MHPLLESIYTTQTVTDGTSTYSALNERGQPFYIDRAEGALLQRVIAAVQPRNTLEVGMAYGVSTLFICEALSKLPHPATHIAIDPHQSTKWHGIALHYARAAGFGEMVQCLEERSEFCLPRLVQQGTTVEVAFIDGLHFFDQCSLEFYYIDRMLPVGGVVIFDDVDWPAIRRAVRLAMSYGSYEVIDRSRASETRPSLAARARRALGALPYLRGALRPDVLVPDQELGIEGSCVALKKISSARPKHGEFRDF